MSTPHIGCEKGDIAKTVIMPGDPLRAKYIAQNFLKDYKVVNKIRNMLAYTGTYKGKEVTVFSSGMGIPSIGIYSYELFKFYDVEKIVRIGTCGSFNKDIKLLDVILSSGAYCKSYFPKLLDGSEVDFVKSSEEFNNIIKTKIETLVKNVLDASNIQILNLLKTDKDFNKEIENMYNFVNDNSTFQFQIEPQIYQAKQFYYYYNLEFLILLLLFFLG